METKLEEACDAIRKQLQLILIRVDLCKNAQQCDTCVGAVGEIVKEIRNLEAFVREVAKRKD